MYDLEIIVPVELNDPEIFKRFQDFKKYGLVNTDGYKIKLWFMASHGNHIHDVNNLKLGWPENFDIETVITPYHHVAQRIYHYYAKYMKPDTARWYMRVDEDSMTDIGGLIKNLDNCFDHTRDFYICGEINRDIQEVERKLLRSLGFDWWYENVRGHDLKDAPAHEFEISVTSNETINKIYNEPKAMSYLNMRQEFECGYGDHAFVFAARMVKVYPISAEFITHLPNILNFSVFGCGRNHIHQVAHDYHPEIIHWIKLIDGGSNPELKHEITTNSYFLNWWEDHRDSIWTWVSFNKNGRLEINPIYQENNKENIGVWDFTKNGDLTIFMTENYYLNKVPIVLEKTEFGFKDKENRRFNLRTAIKNI